MYEKPDGTMKEVGEKIFMPQLAKTLDAISDNPDKFYTGEIAGSIVKTVSDAKGILTMNDLASYAIRMEDVLEAKFGGKRSCYNYAYIYH